MSAFIIRQIIYLANWLTSLLKQMTRSERRLVRQHFFPPKIIFKISMSGDVHPIDEVDVCWRVVARTTCCGLFGLWPTFDLLLGQQTPFIDLRSSSAFIRKFLRNLFRRWWMIYYFGRGKRKRTVERGMDDKKYREREGKSQCDQIWRFWKVLEQSSLQK